METLKLVQINEQGTPENAIEQLSEIAQEVCMAMASLYKSVGFIPPWVGYLALSATEVVGTCAFKAPPLNEKVEIAYFTFPEFEGQGVATAMVHNLVQIARKNNPKITITAQTLPEFNASNSILKKQGFEFVGSLVHPQDGEVWEWHFYN